MLDEGNTKISQIGISKLRFIFKNLSSRFIGKKIVERILSHQQLIADDADGPNVNFFRVASIKHLWRSVLESSSSAAHQELLMLVFDHF